MTERKDEASRQFRDHARSRVGRASDHARSPLASPTEILSLSVYPQPASRIPQRKCTG